jgi:deazaflavin-dependent oxidoreductase (nitroreductase family)
MIALMSQPVSRPTLEPLRRFAIQFVNPVTRLFSGWVPGFAMLTYRGRSTGRLYRTPINVFRQRDHFVFALTYGSGSQWVKNVLAAGTCEMQRMGRRWKLIEPEPIVDPSARLIPMPIRLFLTRIGRVSEFVRMKAVVDRSG